MAYIDVKDGPDAGQRFQVVSPKTILGRLSDCDVVIDGVAVSRRHARIVSVGDSRFLEDMASRNGTFLNGREIEGRRRLKDGDRIGICDITLLYRSKDPETSQPLDESGFAPVLVDDDPNVTGSIMSTITVEPGEAKVTAHETGAKLAALLEITRALGRTLVPDEVLPKILDSLFKIFIQADRGFIVLVEEGGTPIPRWTKLRHEQEKGGSLQISRTIVQQVIDSREAILSADAANDTRFEMSESIVDFRIRSMMCAPLINVDGKVLGVLQLDTLDQRRRFEKDDLDVLAAVGSQAAIALDNARLHENTLQQREIERDLLLAREVQRGFLPKRPPQAEGYEFYDFYRPANQIGGDYYDYVTMPDGRFAVIVADVVGHGVAAALLMARLSAEARFCLGFERHPGAALTRLNNILTEDNLEDRFITLVLIVVDPKTHEAMIANAGHMPPLLRTSNGAVLEFGAKETGAPLGIMQGVEYEECATRLMPNEMMLLFTDGITESMGSDGAMYGTEKIREQMAMPHDGARHFGKSLLANVSGFTGDNAQFDDMCLVCFGRCGVPEKKQRGATAAWK